MVTVIQVVHFVQLVQLVQVVKVVRVVRGFRVVHLVQLVQVVNLVQVVQMVKKVKVVRFVTLVRVVQVVQVVQIVNVVQVVWVISCTLPSLCWNELMTKTTSSEPMIDTLDHLDGQLTRWSGRSRWSKSNFMTTLFSTFLHSEKVLTSLRSGQGGGGLFKDLDN